MSFNIIRLFIVYLKFIDKTDFTLKHYNFLSIRKLVPFLEKKYIQISLEKIRYNILFQLISRIFNTKMLSTACIVPVDQCCRSRILL